MATGAYRFGLAVVTALTMLVAGCTASAPVPAAEPAPSPSTTPATENDVPAGIPAGYEAGPAVSVSRTRVRLLPSDPNDSGSSLLHVAASPGAVPKQGNARYEVQLVLRLDTRSASDAPACGRVRAVQHLEFADPLLDSTFPVRGAGSAHKMHSSLPTAYTGPEVQDLRARLRLTRYGNQACPFLAKAAVTATIVPWRPASEGAV